MNGVLEVASINAKTDKSQPTTANKSNNPAATKNPNEVTGFKAAVVFVIDSTISMDPYINRTREAVKKL